MSRIDELVAALAPDGVTYMRVGDAVSVVPTAKGVKRDNYTDGSKIPIVDQGQSLIAGYTDDDSLVVSAGNHIVFGDHTREVKWVDFAFAPGADGTKVLAAATYMDAKFAYYAIANLEVPSRGYNRHWTILRELRIPVPPLEVQREIVRVFDSLSELELELEAELKIELEARRRQYAYYRGVLLAPSVQSDWTTLPEISTNLDSKRKPVTKSAREAGSVPYYGASGVVDYVNDYIFNGDYLLVSEDGANLLARSTPIAFSITGKTWVNNHAHVLKFSTYAERRFVELYLNSISLAPFVSGGAQPKLSQANLNIIPIPAFAYAQQVRIVAVLDKLEALVNDLNDGLHAELDARRTQCGHYRDKSLTFKEAGR